MRTSTPSDTETVKLHTKAPSTVVSVYVATWVPRASVSPGFIALPDISSPLRSFGGFQNTAVPVGSDVVTAKLAGQFWMEMTSMVNDVLD
jgi:hypothetical protein